MPRVFNVAFALAITVTTVMSVQPAAAQLMFPRNHEEVIALWDAQVWDSRLGVNRRPFGNELVTTRITENGWLVDFFASGGGDLAMLWGPLCIDYSPDQTHEMSTLRHMPVVENHGSSWHRVEVPNGTIANWWGFQISVYGFECPTSSGVTRPSGSTSTGTSGGGQSQTQSQTQTQTTAVTQSVDVDVNVSGAGAAAQPGTVIVTQPQAPQVPPAPPQALCPLQPDHFAGFFPGTSISDWSRTASNGTLMTNNGGFYRGQATVIVPADHVVDTNQGRRFAGQQAQGPFSAYDLVRCA